MTATTETSAGLTEKDIYDFDLRGFLILRNAIPSEILREGNAILDELRKTKPGHWAGYVHGHFFSSEKEGLNLQQIYEAGAPFEFLIDNPAWIEKVKHFVGGKGDFDYNHGPLFIDENFASIRGPGQAIGLHSGGHMGTKRTQFRYHNGRFQCGMINILMAFNDVGPGDGATMVIPGSHKAHFQNPQFEQARMDPEKGGSVDGVEGAIEVHLNAGDALLFVDALSHGSAKRVNAGERRIAVYRYGPSWGFFRHPYRPSLELLERLSPERRQIVMPHEKVLAPPDCEPAVPYHRKLSTDS